MMVRGLHEMSTLVELKNKEPIANLHRYWEECIGGGEASILLRESPRKHLSDCATLCGFKRVRIHDTFGDSMYVYREDVDGLPEYNWQYIDDIYDYLIETGIRPYVSFTYMPKAMAAKSGLYLGKSRFNASPPKDYSQWGDLVRNFTNHCIQRYGLGEVQTWYFEAWNEPDLMFGHPFDNGYWAAKIEDFFKLYATMACTLKEIDSDFKVGGPSTSCFNDYSTPGKLIPPYIDSFLEYCREENVPLDYISVHPYPTNFPNDQLGKDSLSIEHRWREKEALKNDAQYMRNVIQNSLFSQIEIHLNEWSISPGSHDSTHDHLFMAPFIIHNMLQCQNLVDLIAFWMFTDIFEEAPPKPSVFSGGFGLVNGQGLRKPAFHAFRFLHELGDQILEQSDNYIVTRRCDGTMVLLFWNHIYFLSDDQIEEIPEGNSKEIELHFDNSICFDHLVIHTIDHNTGSVKDSWLEMGAPEPPSREQLGLLTDLAEPRIEIKSVNNSSGTFKFDLPAHSVKLIEIKCNQ
jgi:xylan 1,4-beta-xylosidase